VFLNLYDALKQCDISISFTIKIMYYREIKQIEIEIYIKSILHAAIFADLVFGFWTKRHCGISDFFLILI